MSNSITYSSDRCQVIYAEKDNRGKSIADVLIKFVDQPIDPEIFAAAHSRKNAFPSRHALLESVVKKRGLKVTPKRLQQANHSLAVTRKDLRQTITILDPVLKNYLENTLHIDTNFLTFHQFEKNGLNGRSFIDETGKRVYVTGATAAPHDRATEKVVNLRTIYDADGKVICGTGRVDTEDRFDEQHKMILRRMGFNNSPHKTYAVTNLMSPSELIALGGGEVDEWESVLKQDELLGRNDAWHFSNTLNLFEKVEKVIFSRFSGEYERKRISKKSYKALLDVARAFPYQPGPRLSLREVKLLDTIIGILENENKRNALPPEQELFLRDLLMKIIKMPTIYHCKSSTDRTGIAIALSSISSLLLRSPGFRFDDEPHKLLEKDWFKELFALYTKAGHQITKYARGAEGIAGGKKMNPENIGWSWGDGLATNPVVARLLPDRYLTETSSTFKFFTGQTKIDKTHGFASWAGSMVAVLLSYILIRPIVGTLLYAGIILGTFGASLRQFVKQRDLKFLKYAFLLPIANSLSIFKIWYNLPDVFKGKLIVIDKANCPEGTLLISEKSRKWLDKN